MGHVWVSWHFGDAMWIFLIMVPLWLKLVIFGVSGERVGVNGKRVAEAYFRRFVCEMFIYLIKIHIL